MRPSRRLAAWVMPRSLLAADVLTLAAERDKWRRQAENAKRIADEAVSVAHRYHDALAEAQARNDSLAADLDQLVTG